MQMTMGKDDALGGVSGCEIIGIAGNIGAGKSVVSRILRCNGYTVYDCDREASVLMIADELLRMRLTDILGEMCYQPDGSLNKAYVAEKIFSSSEHREKVNSVVHEAVRNDILSQAARKGKGKLFVESAIMATSGLDRLCSAIWVVDAPEDVRLRRVMLRNGMTEEDVRARMETQRGELALLPEDKVVVVHNDDSSKVLNEVIHLVDPNVESQSFEITCMLS